MRATPDALTLRAEAADEANLRRVQELLTRRLETIGRRDHLTVNWHRLDGITSTAVAIPPHRRRNAIILTAAGALAVAAHLGLGGAALTAARWPGWAADAILVVIVVKVLAVAVIARRAAARQSTRT
jgi:hypothetical protein